MRIFTLSPSTISVGAEAFRTGIRQYLSSAHGWRDSGVEVIPGAIAAAIRAGITDENEICHAVGRVARCRVSAVATVLHGLSDEHVAGRLWAQTENGTFVPKGNMGRVPPSIAIH